MHGESTGDDAPLPYAGRGSHIGSVALSTPAHCELADAEFLGLLSAFRASGGLAREADLLARWRRETSLCNTRAGKTCPHGPAPMATALRLRWDGCDWLPVFQFHLPTLQLRQDVLRVRDELVPVFEGSRLLAWFIEPNHWLRGVRPIDSLGPDLAGVLGAARGDRFIVAG